MKTVGEGLISGRFKFPFQGSDEDDRINGWGWVTLKGLDNIKCEIQFFQGEESGFVAKKIGSKPWLYFLLSHYL